ncbi:hypothetical protein [Calothrix sp. PCC 6303]|uniref:hypothetical protein n=1 Tax=Calothrix sp. PCC 6303 TaxID=1170562 RepID=UPI0002A034E0|nr:hypothetical protein [Calothrix sp. PCC 6303]AFZ03176.1 hypothetical protein Cal6303_4267 [Calothrix sp. PCC 6303]
MKANNFHRVSFAFTILGISAALFGFQNPVTAQSSSEVKSGDSLTGINNRDAQADFNNFFGITNSNNNPRQTTKPVGYSETLTLPNTPILLQPAQSVNGNDGVQLQLDLGNLESQTK